ncbi:ATP-binding cassette domain-containing protein [Ideonella sp. DXS29W]|uniref:ATP-binding cassette domain-containing protein n=1 Tax=Ideonella lacteola TaxID=2984193 RepID=A0ABU9BNB8_9BURK
MSSPSALELVGVSAPAAPASRVPALHGLDLRLEPGEQVAVIGASGAGKSSLLLTMAAAVRPLGGQLRLAGVDPWVLGSAGRHRLRAQLFLAPQVPPLPPRQRVVTSVLAGGLPAWPGWWRGWLFGWSDADASRAQAALQAFDIADKLWLRVDRLSGGERQRVGLARALVSAARWWLVDEPLSALDPARAHQALGSLQAAARDSGRTLVCTLHQVDLARERFARIVALRAGRIVYDGPAAGLDDEAVRALYSPSDADGTPSPPGADPIAPPAWADAPPDLSPGPPGALCR